MKLSPETYTDIRAALKVGDKFQIPAVPAPYGEFWYEVVSITDGNAKLRIVPDPKK